MQRGEIQVVHSFAFVMFCMVPLWRNLSQFKSSIFAIQVGPEILESFQISIDWKTMKTKSLLVQMRKNLCTGFFTDLFKMWNTKVCIYQKLEATEDIINKFASHVQIPYIKTGDLKSTQNWQRFLFSKKFKNCTYLFTCILHDYMAHDIPKEFLENSHFENTTAGFLLRCQNLLRLIPPKMMHFQAWKKMILTNNAL